MRWMAVRTAPTIAPGGPTGGVAACRWGSVSRTRPQTAEEVDASADGDDYEEDLHWEPLSAPE
jgi:hypothetical protein